MEQYYDLKKTNRIRIKAGSRLPLEDLKNGEIFAGRQYFSSNSAYMKTEDSVADGIRCINLSNGHSLVLKKDSVQETVRSFNIEVNGNTYAGSPKYLPVGSIISFNGFTGEKFIKAVISHSVQGKDGFPETVHDIKYYSLSTGIGLTETDADIIDMPVTVYDAEFSLVV